jgi:hypothetical protein
MVFAPSTRAATGIAINSLISPARDPNESLAPRGVASLASRARCSKNDVKGLGRGIELLLCLPRQHRRDPSHGDAPVLTFGLLRWNFQILLTVALRH